MLDFQGFSPFLYARLSLICRLNLQEGYEKIADETEIGHSADILGTQNFLLDIAIMTLMTEQLQSV